MRELYNDNQITSGLLNKLAIFLIVPILAWVPVFTLDIEIESTYDYILEVTRLYCVLVLASIAKGVISSQIIRTGIILAILNGIYDALTEIVFIDIHISSRFPFADALLDEALLIGAYACIIIGSYNYLRQVNKLALTDNLTNCYTRAALKIIPKGNYQLFYFDIDNLNELNNERGHNFGDKLLYTFGDQLINCCNDIGYAYRVGGDEFIAIIDIESARKFIDQFMRACDRESIQFSYGTAPWESGDITKATIEAKENLSEMQEFKASPYLI
ncbi:GGDEF domain-containing protein [Vibrio rhodolitus]|uniref:GGDEF domain-containing protein n=1 Tax=Vibrio rhodolitus TaxID=2231649 RepID=UPI000E0AA867|nr:diguanylate cyclase [Vibrio rhodolitus]